MASLRSPSRLWPALFAAVVLSALSAAEATLASAPLYDAADVHGDWPAQLTPVKDRDSANSRAARPADSDEERVAPSVHGGGPAVFDGSPPSQALARTAMVQWPCDQAAAGVRLSPHRLGLPPPVC